MDALIAVVARFTNLAEDVPEGASHFEGAVTVWPSKYASGQETGGAAIKVGKGKKTSVFNLYLEPSALSQFAGFTEPGGLFEFELGMTANDGIPRFSLESVDLAEGNKPASAMTASIAEPVLTQVTPSALSVLCHAESESHLDVGAPAGMGWNPALEKFVGMTLPSLEVAFERRLVPGPVQNPPSARAVGGNPRMYVPAHPVADLATL